MRLLVIGLLLNLSHHKEQIHERLITWPGLMQFKYHRHNTTYVTLSYDESSLQKD